MKGLAAIRLHGLRVQVLLWIILPLIIGLIIFSLTGVSSHQGSMRTLVAEDNTKLAAALSNSIAIQLDRYRMGLQAIAALQSIHPEDRQATAQHLKDISEAWDGFSLFLVSAEGDILTNASISSPFWINEAIEHVVERSRGSSAPTEFMMTTVDRSVIFWGVPVPQTMTWLLGGIAMTELGVEQIVDVEHPDAETSIMLVDREGFILVGRAALPLEAKVENWPGIAQALAGETGVLFVPASQSQDEDIVTYASVPGTGWALVIREPWHALTTPLIRFEQAMPFILAIATIVSFLTLYFGLRYVVRPLRLLSAQVRRIGQGDFEAATQPVGGFQEIEDLHQTLDQMAHQVQRYQAALQDYLHAITQSQEEERARLGRELHDETVQTLIALDHKAQVIQRSSDANATQTVERVTELRRMIAAAIKEVRRFSRALRPIYLEELGLVPALELLAKEAGARFRISGSPSRLKADQELALYRIAQESLNNAKHHAKAQHLSLEVTFADSVVMLRIYDDGVGFEVPSNLNELTRAGHFGLMGMRERAQLVGGQMNVTSSPTRGTVVTVTLPQSLPQ